MRRTVKEEKFVEVCTCKHTGGTVGTQHAPRYSPGHGPCLVPGCKCQQFTWVKRILVKP